MEGGKIEKELIEEAANKNTDLSGLNEIFETWIDAQDLFGEKLDTTRHSRWDEKRVNAIIKDR